MRGRCTDPFRHQFLAKANKQRVAELDDNDRQSKGDTETPSPHLVDIARIRPYDRWFSFFFNAWCKIISVGQNSIWWPIKTATKLWTMKL